MSLVNVFHIAASALTAQSMRLNAVASNMANADSAHASTGEGYKAKQVVFQAVALNASAPWAQGVRMKAVVEDPSPGRLVYDPKHPLADSRGYVAYPNVDPVEEMVNMISASRSYQTNAEVMSTAKSLLQRTLAIAQT
ncbi:MAG TPA: flagellar basal body rod protein FlgC [Thiobacillaceae bacterium]|nr:flagellar basal body rod protein FlgC [Thiobacillaceae bacterium]HNA81692.1 flagellar basal body rod protein FlgC [Thiobacillaceae bacterium]HNF87937.1 flagellar basal body rod protein FlgC [Thiobacillaceae bacterium]HNH88162.1 flagellar basal body rod protein FlgC [Thiobacillaceae bacterium]HNI07096.1 flagellar basal body rod protein FlgC [Thiobacillaceae bacterium]